MSKLRFDFEKFTDLQSERLVSYMDVLLRGIPPVSEDATSALLSSLDALDTYHLVYALEIGARYAPVAFSLRIPGYLSHPDRSVRLAATRALRSLPDDCVTSELVEKAKSSASLSPEQFTKEIELLSCRRVIQTKAVREVARRKHQAASNDIRTNVAQEVFFRLPRFRESTHAFGQIADYTIIKPIKSGAYGQTYLTRVSRVRPREKGTPRLKKGQTVVIKVPPTLDRKKHGLKKCLKFLKDVNAGFQAEYELIHRIRGLPNAATVLDKGVVDVAINGLTKVSFFVVYEFIEGKDLADYFRSPKTSFRGLRSADEFFKWARKLALGLDQIHQRGVIHGDIWPNNIMIRKGTEDIVYIDFGQTALRNAVLAEKFGSQSHAYIAPEGEKTVLGDIYSLCALLFWLATGRDQPFRDDPRFKNPDTLKRELVRKLEKMNRKLFDDNCGIADVISRGLRHVKEERTQDCGQLIIDIALFDSQSSKRSAAVELRSTLRGVAKNIPRLARAEPLFARIIQRRFRRLQRQVEDMLNGYQEVRGDHWTLAVTLSQYLSALKPGDVYLTASQPLAWRKDNLGVNGRFLSMHRVIVERGVTVRRVFVVTPNEARTKWVRQILGAHKALLNRLDKTKIRTRVKRVRDGGLFTGVMIRSKKERDKLFAEHPHAGNWISGSKVKLVLPYYDPDTGVMRGARLRPGECTAKETREEFERNFLEPAKELRAYLRRP